ncbi:MAG: histidine phosphatase family protein [Ruminococcaceae bacterium]|nr:histidine phosphatase family protein [Oscillospiraceae bacterium]
MTARSRWMQALVYWLSDSMKTTLYMIRHGQSRANLEGCFLGQGDWDLTELGHAQAECAASYLKGLRCDAIYASDLCRAFHTAQHTADAVGLPVVAERDLREIDAGDWEFMPFEEIDAVYPTAYKRWRENIDRAQCVNGESVMHLQERVVAMLRRIARQHAGQTVLLFSHATPIRVAAAHCLGKAVKDVPWATNASATKFEYEDGELTLADYSYDAYMGELVTNLPANV